jgi:polysaccharide export outer membrane protein
VVVLWDARSGVPATTHADTGRGGGGGDYTVDADGLALLPLLGLVRVADRPFAEVRREIERAFAEEYVDATVRVTPLVRIALLGEVRTPGLLPVDPTMTLADVVAAAGGLTPSANRKDVRLVRDDETLLVTAEGEMVGLRVPLRSGDRIVVGRRSWASENLPFVLGAGAWVVGAVLPALIVRCAAWRCRGDRGWWRPPWASSGDGSAGGWGWRGWSSRSPWS